MINPGDNNEKAGRVEGTILDLLSKQQYPLKNIIKYYGGFI